MSLIFDEQSLHLLSVDNLLSYLLQHGWQERRYTDTRFRVFLYYASDKEPILLMVPISSKLTDFFPRLTEAIVVLAQVEKVSPATLLQTLNAANNDMMRLRLTFPAGQNPSLDLTAQFIEGFRDLVIFSAYMEMEEKRRYYKRVSDTARQEAKQFQFCHTFQGSFGFAMASPLVQQPLFEDHPPIERRIVERITRGLSITQQATAENSSSIISQRYTEGLNGNMCNAVASMLKDLLDISVEYSVDWSPRLAPAADIKNLHPIFLSSGSVKVLQQAGEHLKRTSDSGTQDLGEQDVHGTIIELKSEKEQERMVIIFSPHFQKNIEAVFSKQDYISACNAHRDQRPITIRGSVFKDKKGALYLENPHGLITR